MPIPTAIGIDFGGTSVKIGLVHEGRIVARRPPLVTQSYAGSEPLIAAMVAEVHALRSEHPDRPAFALGVGMPGFVDSVGGVVHNLTNVAGWHEVPLATLLTSRTGLPTVLENDAKAMTYAEWKHGAARGRSHVICITLGTGVGGGLILGGRLHRGAAFAAGEVGQMSLDPLGEPGNYGNLGALEKYVGNQQISERALELYAAALHPAPEGELSPLVLEQAARRGDPVALRLWAEVASRVGFMLSNLVWLLNPDAIVIGGGVAKAGDLIFPGITHEIRTRCAELLWSNLIVVPAKLGNDAGLIGAASLGIDALAARR